jgi:AraC-like DNA-binding protein
MSIQDGQVLTVSSRALVDACERLGVDVDALVTAVDLQRVTLNDPDARISMAQAGALWQKAYQLTGDPDLSLHAVEALEFGAYKVIDFMVSHAKTVGDGFGKISEYFPLINTTVSLPITKTDDEISFGLQPNTHEAPISRAYAEYTFGACYLRVRTSTGEFKPERIEFTHDMPASTSEHERIFGCPVIFGAKELRLVFSYQVWEQKAINPNPQLLDVLNQHARMLLDAMPEAGDLAADVRKAVLDQLRGGSPTLEHVGKQLGMSGRTLQRRLKEELLSYTDLLDELREGMAKEYLADRDISICEVAFLLGFSEQSAFNRAFKRWTGQTPLKFRKT